MKDETTDVSIIITNYNYSRYLSRAIRSCISQKFVNAEVIVIDDCSTDNSMQVISFFEDKIKIIQNERNLGVGKSSNIGVKTANARYVIRVDADDFISADTCYIMKRYLSENRDAFCVACDYWLVDEYENKIERKCAKEKNISCGIMYRRDLFLELGGYNPKMRHREEEELRKRLGKKYRIDYLKMPFYRYRMHDKNKTKSEEYLETKIWI